MNQLLWMIATCIIVTFAWLMLKLARFTTPVSGSIGLLVFGLGLKLNNDRIIAFGGGLLIFSLVMLAISKNI